MSKSQKNNTTYKEYLGTFKKEDINKILDFYGIDYRKNLSKEKCIDLIISSLDNMINKSLDIFQNDELANLKYIVKKNGYIELRVNYLLSDFLNTLNRNYLAIKENDKTFIIPKDVLSIINKKINKKDVLDKIKENTSEYQLLLGFIDAYGVIDFEQFYNSYAKLYKLHHDDALERIKFYSEYFSEFKVYKEKTKYYLTSNNINNLKECKKYINKKENYKIYTNEELKDIHTFKYMEDFRSYKKLIKYIRTNYDINKNNIKVVNKWVLIPYLQEYQLDKNVAKDKLLELVDKYFEINTEKQKQKFATLAEGMAMDYPSWRLNGYSEKEHV